MFTDMENHQGQMVKIFSRQKFSNKRIIPFYLFRLSINVRVYFYNYVKLLTEKISHNFICIVKF